MTMTGRDFTITGKKSRHSINGQERSEELNDNFTSAKFWEYDSRIGRRWNRDPKPNLSISPYSTFMNNPLLIVDVFGDTTYLYNTSGVYKGVLYDGLKTNEIVILSEKRLNNVLRLQYSDFKKATFQKTFSDDELAEAVRSPDVCEARITDKSVKEITSMWKSSGENIGLLYADKKTKEVHASLASVIVSKKGSTQGDAPSLPIDFENISKKGNVIGVWHSHPYNSYLGKVLIGPDDRYKGTLASEADKNNVSGVILKMKFPALGIITQKNIITLFSINARGAHDLPIVRDKITTSHFSKNFNAGMSAVTEGGEQNASFDKNLSPKTFWEY